MMYAINNPYKEKILHSKDTAYNTITHITLDYVTESICTTIYNINGEVV